MLSLDSLIMYVIPSPHLLCIAQKNMEMGEFSGKKRPASSPIMKMLFVRDGSSLKRDRAENERLH